MQASVHLSFGDLAHRCPGNNPMLGVVIVRCFCCKVLPLFGAAITQCALLNLFQLSLLRSEDQAHVEGTSLCSGRVRA